ncbi:C-GCAxxG-C-C family protein [Desulfovibrio sp. OttesenSCG-928-G15]|nr:C-GCAxxG-C-C family protein [Desulfovibrio sp. OttesenSCG-928-G15]
MNSKIPFLKEAQKRAADNFSCGLSCSESVYEALLYSGAVSEQDAPRSTCSLCVGFAGGIGLSGFVCGALSAAVMAVGAKFGRKDPHINMPDALQRERGSRRFNSMVNHFTLSMQTVMCDAITKPYQDNWDVPERKLRCAEAVAAAVATACLHLALAEEEVATLPWGYTITKQKQEQSQ